MKRDIEIEGETTWKPERRVRKAHKPARLAKCAQCGNVNPPPGTRSQAIDIIDKLGLFCTLRCAARYGVRTVEERLQ